MAPIKYLINESDNFYESLHIGEMAPNKSDTHFLLIIQLRIKNRSNCHFRIYSKKFQKIIDKYDNMHVIELKD